MLLMLALFSAAVVLRVWLLAGTPFDGLYGQDAYAYHDFAQALRLSISTGNAPGPFFWPLGYPALLAGAYALFGAGGSTGQAVSILCGALLSPLLYGLARQIGIGRGGALVAALVIAACGQALQSSLVVMADIPALAVATLSAVTLWRYRQRGGAGWLAATAFLLALAGITRWLYLVLALPWLAAVLVERARPLRRREIAAALATAALVLLPQMVYSSSSPFPLLNHPWVVGWSPAHATLRVFDNDDGHFAYAEPNAQFYAHPFYDPYFLSPLLTPLLLIGVWVLRRRRAPLLMLLGWALLPYLFLIGIPYQNIRFPLIAMPAVALLVGAGANRALAWHPRWSRLVPATMTGLVIVALAQMLLVSRPVVRQFIANQQADKAAVAWVAQQIPAQATLYTYGLTLTLRHYTDFDVHELYFETPTTLAQARAPGRVNYLFCNVGVIENQWKGRTPQIAYDWLKEQRGLIPLGRYGSYQLFRLAR